MDFFQLSMRVLSALIMAYFFLIMLRIILSWFAGNLPAMANIRSFINRLTDPYMNYFRNVKWLRFGMLDFSPVLGIAVLSFLLFLTQRLSVGSFPGMGELLVWLIGLVWNFIAFLAMIFAIVMIIRLVTLYTHKNSPPEWVYRLDTFLFPRVSRILGVFTKRSISYSLALGLCILGILSARFLISWLLSRYLFPLLIQL